MSGQFGEVAAIAPIFNGVKYGSYVDVGAHDGITDSNTLHFDRRGWWGICVEPHRVYYRQLLKNRPYAKCLDVAIWKDDADEIIFHATTPGGFSRLVEPLLNADWQVVDSYNVRAITMKRLLEENLVPAPLDLLSVDVEGHESEVLSTFDVAKYRPRVAIIEDMRHAGFDDVFTGYEAFRGWKTRFNSPNVLYVRDAVDAARVDGPWREGR